MIDSEYVLANAVVEIISQRGGGLTVADIGHLFGSTAVDDEWERLVPTWCDPPLTLAELEALVWPIVHERVDQLSLRPGVADLIEAAKGRHWQIALATGHVPERLKGRLERLDVARWLDAVVLAREIPHGKPAPDIFLEAARRLKLRANECVVIEDSLPGSQAAIAAGMTVIVCPSAVTAHLEFPPTARRVTSLAEVRIEDVEYLLQARLAS